MVFPVVGGNLLDTGYNIQNSGRFDNTGGSALGGTFGTPTNDKKFTLSMWHKKSSGTTSGGQVLFGARSGYENIFLHEETVRWDWNNASSGTLNWAPFIRDQSAWYHFVFAQDTTQGTDTNRAKLYINGRQITTLRSGVTANYPGQNLATGYNVDGQPFYVSSYNGSAAEINGYLADVAFIDGSQLDPSYFGETNDNGVWIPKEFKNDVTFGNNGFFLEFKQTGTGTNSSGIGADTSGNDNHLSVTGLAAIDVTVDTPTNNFATWNPLDAASNIGTRFAEGNMDVDVPGNNVVSGAEANGCLSTMQFSKGKWYFEMKYEYGANGFQDTAGIGLIRTDTGFSINGSTDTRNFSDNVFYYVDGPKTIDGTHTSYGDAWTQNDIIGVAANLDDDEVYFYKNGTIQNSGTAISKTFGDGFYSIANFHGSANGGALFRLNTGNPSFSISSGNSDANGYGNFEYSVPSGYYAICTKNLAQYG